MRKFIGKSKERNNGVEVLLIDHLTDVANKCAYDSNKHVDNKTIEACAYIVGFAHDLGKATCDFQNHILTDSKEEYDHSYVSAFLIKNYVKFHSGLDDFKDAIIYTILNHHPLTHIENDMTIDDEVIDNEVIGFLRDWINIYNSTEYGVEFPISFVDRDIDECSMPIAYWLEDRAYNRKLLYFTSILRHADIICSNTKLDENELIGFNQIHESDIVKPEAYDERFFEQKEIAVNAIQNNFSMLVAQAGWGKTMSGLIYLLQGNKKGYWICPRVEITHGIFKGVIRELSALGLNDKVSVAEMTAGKYIESNNDRLEDYQRGIAIPDITVINIDSFLRPLFNTDSNIRMASFVNSNCIFDEFHEYFTKDAIMALYDTLMTTRKAYCSDVKTLLMSASEESVLFDKFVQEDNIYYGHCKFMEERKINIVFDEFPSEVNGEDHVIFVKSVKSCQNIKMCGVTDHIVHARFTDDDKTEHLDLVIGRHGKVSDSRNYSCVATNVIGVGLDITFNRMTISYPTPNDLLQFIGRLDRHCNMEDVTLYLSNNETIKKSETCVVNINFSDKMQGNFYQFVKKNLGNGVHTKGEIIECINKYKSHNKPDYKKLYKEFMRESLKALIDIDYRYTSVFESEDDTIFISNKNSIRSNNPDKIFIFIPNSEMNEPMQVDLKDGIIDEALLRRSINKTMDLVRKQEYGVYYMNKHAMENSFRGKDPYAVLKKKALCNKTPYLIGADYEYTKELGLRKK